MKFLSVRKGGLKGGRVRSQPIRPLSLLIKKINKENAPPDGWALPKVYKRASPQAHKLSSLTMKQYPLLWDFIRLNRKG